MRSDRLALLLLVVTLGVGACGVDGTGDGPDAGDHDGGEPPTPVCDGTAAPPGIDAGKTGVDFVPYIDGDLLPSWSRPQGGIGTRINVKLLGFVEEAPFAALTTRLYLEPRTTGALPGEGDACTSDETCGPNLACYDATCRPLVCEQINARFPTDCIADGNLQVPEMPVRFFDDFSLMQLDGNTAALVVEIALDGGETYQDAVDVQIDVGPFIEPSWWDDLDG